ncbi:MAG: SpoIID/LytB domain-containing protein [Planctomycetes bacterium]|nr:SpoIID/LytB domain-containing protein [Planctomycetota bacterium]
MRNTASVWCLIVCTALLWGAWKISSSAENPTPPALQLWPFSRRAPAKSPNAPAPQSGPAARPSVSAAPDTRPTPPASASATAAPVNLPPEPMPDIRVALLPKAQKSVNLEVSQSFTVREIGTEKILQRSEKIGNTIVSATAQGLRIGKKDWPHSKLEIVPSQSPGVWIEGHQYRGTVRLYRLSGNQVFAVNVLPLEDYVASVVDSEMPSAFPEQARQAQAVIARTYALYQRAAVERGALADLQASTKSQKYLGYQYRDGKKLLAGESEASRKIAAATRGQVCQFRGREFCTYYCAVCGGSTVRGTDFFADAAPPLKSVPCEFCREARLYRWQAEISRTDFQQALAPWLKEKGQPHSVVKTVSLTRKTSGQSGYPEFDLRDGRQTLRITGPELRQYLGPLGLYSPRFSITDRGQTLEFHGQGHGHGIGLCQWGARGQALAGRSCQQILQHYYPGMTLAVHTWK